ncbi:sigma-70 family RNA polymerase sigma factor [Clostridium senegalense]|uniref:sigma-70 family RNA polymerase sigma factor n=1 Tax=Clostridium senegalense TaxID=1465809 RepID=UPI001C11788F|nr:sigma-70 family RNA polymerase sigma factor [Clostridium senegalense]MBU5228072.1 hypothetical protein [Clostridium senegalense]
MSKNDKDLLTKEAFREAANENNGSSKYHKSIEILKNKELLDKLLESAQQGDEKAKKTLILGFKPYIVTLAKGVFIKGYELEDLIMVGYESVLKCIKFFTPCQGAFLNYTMRAIKLNFNALIKKEAENNSVSSLSSPIGEGVTLVDTVIDSFDLEENFLNKCRGKQLVDLINDLPKDDRDLIYYCYVTEQATIKDLAKIKGVNYRTLLRRKDRIFRRLSHLLM